MLQFDRLKKFETLFHLITTKNGGVSIGNYSTFNLGMHTGDDIECVNENFQRLASIIGVDKKKVVIPHQVHGDKICVINNTFISKTSLEQLRLLDGVDAIITNQTDIFIGVCTADCIPILIYDPIQNVLAVIHSGWRGTVARIVEKTILKMREEFGCISSNLIGCIGPGICQECFEVGEEVVEAFIKKGFIIDSIAYKNKKTGKTHINLALTNKVLLLQSGLLFSNIETMDLCTYNNSDLFFSARRQGLKSGRMITGGILCNI